MRKLLAMILALALALTVSGTALAAEDAEPEASPEATAEATEKPKATEKPEPTEAPVEGTVILDADGLSVLLVSQQTNDRGDYIWQLHAVNDTNAAVMVTLDRFVLNGTYCEAAFGMALAAGETADAANYWPAASLASAGLEGLEEAASACFRLNAINTEDPEADAYADETVTLELAEGGAPAYEPADTDILVFDNDTAAMYITGFVPSPDISQYVVNVMLLNKTDDAISVEMADGYIGPEYMTSGYMKQFVPAHAAAPGSWGWGYEWMLWNGYYGDDGLIRSDLDMTLNINIYDEDDATVETVRLEAVPVEH